MADGERAEGPEGGSVLEPRPEGGRQSLRGRIRQMLIGVFLLDAGVLFLTSVYAWYWADIVDRFWDQDPYPFNWAPLLGPGLIGIWLAMLVALGAYRPRHYGAGFEEFRAITVASSITFGIACAGGFLSANQPTRGYPILFFLIGTPLLLIVRYLDRKALHLARSQGRLAIRLIAVGSAKAVAELIEALDRAQHTGYRVVGACIPDGVDDVGLDVPVLGDIGSVHDSVISEDVDGVIVAGGSYSSAADLRRLGWDLQGLAVDLLVVPSLVDIAGPRVHMRHVAGLPFVHVDEPQSDRAGGWAKRAFDLVAATGLLVVLSPLLLLIALLIRLQDRGPAFYRQVRMGSGGETFEMIKFRSMVVNADQMLDQLADANEHDGVLFKIREDPRLTRIGRFIRKYSIDELPQLFNVVRGEMSLVGPRPPLPDEVERYEHDTHRRMLVRPGMTGLWQVSGRSDLTWSESVRLDLYYVDNWSMVIDLVIILKTVKAVFASEGAY